MAFSLLLCAVWVQLKPGCFSYSKTRTPTKHFTAPSASYNDFIREWFAGHNWNTVRYLLFVHWIYYVSPTGTIPKAPKNQSSHTFTGKSNIWETTLPVSSWDISQSDFICQTYGLVREAEKWDHLHLLTSQNPRSECLRRLWGLTYNFYGSVGTRYYTYSITLASGL